MGSALFYIKNALFELRKLFLYFIIITYSLITEIIQLDLFQKWLIFEIEIESLHKIKCYMDSIFSFYRRPFPSRSSSSSCSLAGSELHHRLGPCQPSTWRTRPTTRYGACGSAGVKGIEKENILPHPSLHLTFLLDISGLL